MADFRGQLIRIGRINPSISSVDEIESEPMIFSGSWDWTYDNCGPITKRIMDSIRDDVDEQISGHAKLGYHPVIDTKSVMLMAKQYPCIPGWHCDGVLRSAKYQQPDLTSLKDDIQHYICCVGENDAMIGTEIIPHNMFISDECIDKNSVWMSIDKQISLSGVNIKSGEVVRISRSTLHRGPAAVTAGWRYFFRLSFYHMPVANRIRHQVQVYTDISAGW